MPITTKPGDKYASIQRPRVYRALRRRGYSKEAAARISNAQAPGHTVKASAAVPAVIPPTGPDALFNQPGIEGRRAKLRKRKMRLKAPNYGARAGQVIAGNLTRGNDGKFSSGGGGAAAAPEKPSKGKKPKQPKKPKQTPEERQAARTQEQAARRDETYSKLGLMEDAADSLTRLGAGEAVEDDGGLVKMGLAETDSSGQLRLTASGRVALNASERGDLGAARDALSRGRDRVTQQGERATARTQRQQALQARVQAREQKKREREAARLAKQQEPKKGGGGGGGGDKKPEKPARSLADALELMRQAAGLTGRKSFTVFKDARGADRWLAVSSTAYRDRDGEIVSRKALQQAVAAGDSTQQRGPLRFWHVPGLDIGTCDYQATAQDGRFLIESGTFHHPSYAQALKTHGDGYQVSIGFLHPETQPDAAGVFHNIAIFERSIVPPGRAANPFTQIRTKEQRMLSTEKLTALKALLGDTPELTALLSQVQETDKTAQARGTAYKEAPPEEIVIGGVTYAVKAFPPKPEEEVKAPAPPAVEAIEEEAAVEGVEETLDDGPLLTEADAAMIAQAVVSAITPLFDIEKKFRGYMDEVKAAFSGGLAQKDATVAEQAAVLAAVQQQLVDQTARLKELEGDQPAGGYRASQRAETTMLQAAMKSLGGLPGLEAQAPQPVPGLTTKEEQDAYTLIYGKTS